MRRLGIDINFKNEIEFYKQNSTGTQSQLRALRVHQVAQTASTNNNRGRIHQAIAQKKPELASIMSLAQIWSCQTPIVKIPRNALMSTLFGPVTIRNVLMSKQVLSIVSRA